MYKAVTITTNLSITALKLYRHTKITTKIGLDSIVLLTPSEFKDVTLSYKSVLIVKCLLMEFWSYQTLCKIVRETIVYVGQVIIPGHYRGRMYWWPLFVVCC